MPALFAFLGLWGTVAVGAAAVSVPVIIHLLNRRRFRVVVWAAMRFLLNAQKQNTRRMRLEQILLLAVRASLILLVVLAMASITDWAEAFWNRVWPDAGSPMRRQNSRIHKIIVLDGSLSMALRTDGGKTCFEKGRDLALQLIKESPPGDGLSVVLMKDVPVWVVGEPALESAKVAREVASLRQAHGNANVAATLNMVAAKLTESGTRFDAREVYFITDLQRSNWLSGAPQDAGKKDGKPGREKTILQEIQQRASTIFVDVGRDNVTNLTVTDVTIDDPLITTGRDIVVMATVQGFGPEKKKGVRVELLVGRAREKADDPPFALRSVATELANVEPGVPVTVPFKHKFSTPGTYAVQVRVEEDELPIDDARTVIVTVRDKVAVLLVNGKPAAEQRDRATEYLQFALNPFTKPEDRAQIPIEPRVVSVSQFADVNDSKLEKYDAIYLADVGKPTMDDLARLEAHLRRGGGLVVSMGDRAAEHLEGYNRLLFKNGAGLLPARLESVRQALPGTHFALGGTDEAFKKPPLKAFLEGDQRAYLSRPPFRRYVEAKPAADAGVQQILSFFPEPDAPDKAALALKLPTGEPAILEWQPPLPAAERAHARAAREEAGQPRPASASRYRGKVILITTSLNFDWGDWPPSGTYVAMMQELVRVAVSGKLRERAQTVGGPLDEFLQPGVAELEGKLYLPGRETEPVKTRIRGADELTIFRWADTDLAGIYRLTVGSDPHDYLFAVNVPTAGGDGRPSESDLARAGKDRLQTAYPAWEFQLVTSLRDVRHADAPITEGPDAPRGKIGPTIAHWLLLGVLILLLAEVVLAWVFGHHTTVPGANNPPRTGLLWPALTAGFALVFFVFIAFTLIHTAQTGDFLGYLGDDVRGTIESWLGVPPPAAGEGTHWHLEYTPFLSDAASDPWLAGGIALAALALIAGIYFVEPKTANVPYKFVLGGLRLFLILLTLCVLLPQLQLRFERQGWPDVALVIDDSKSMSVPDHFREDDVQTKADTLGEHIRKQIQKRLPERIQALQAQRDALSKAGDPRVKAEADTLNGRIRELEGQLSSVNSPNFKPSRLQLAQALLSREDPDWIGALLSKRRMKVHIFHLDAQGRLVKLKDARGSAGEITGATEAAELVRTRTAIANLQPTGNDSRLGTAVRQVLDYYRGASLTAVIMLTDGVTTKDESIGQVAEYAGQRGVPLFFVGVGDDHEVRDLKLHDLQVEDTVYLGDRLIFEARLTGRGYKDLTVPVVLKIREKDGKEKVLKREKVRIDPRGNPVKVQFRDQPDTPGEKLYIVEVEMPRLERDEKAPNPTDLRLQRTVFVQDSKLIKVLYVEGAPRYEFRFLKALLERESPDKKKTKSIELKVVLTDADEGFAAQDRTALVDFPATRQELFDYDVIILGDVDPRSRKIGEARLRDLADFVRERGGGLLMIAGSQFSPHAYKGTALADVLPIEPSGVVPIEPEEGRPEGYRPELTPVGRRHPIFRFSPDDAENMGIWQRLAPMFWWAEGYTTKPLAEVLAVHPKAKAQGKAGHQEQKGHPLVAQQFVGAGRCMFFGFDETWRWRFREDELRFNQFWIQTVRYLSRSRISRTTLRLDRQTPYRVGEPIKVTVQFPETALLPGQQPGKKAPDKLDVKVMVEHKPAPGADGEGETEIQTLQLAKVEGSWATYEGILIRTREGKYKFSLTTPDVSRQQPSGERPNAEAVVVQPPGELDRLRMNIEELKQAAEATEGQFYTLATADRVLDDLPAGVRVVLNTPRAPEPLWNHLLLFLLVLGLLASEWVLRKRKHLL